MSGGSRTPSMVYMTPFAAGVPSPTISAPFTVTPSSVASDGDGTALDGRDGLTPGDLVFIGDHVVEQDLGQVAFRVLHELIQHAGWEPVESPFRRNKDRVWPRAREQPLKPGGIKRPGEG